MLPLRRLPFPGHQVVDVAVGIMQEPGGRLLLAERPAHQDAPGFWEIPGGKIEDGETPEQAVVRELSEELGIQVDRLRPWRTYGHDFPSKRVRLHFFRILTWSGTPQGREGQRIAWVDPVRPDVGPLLASNHLAMTVLALPPLIGVARVGSGPNAFDDLLMRIPSLVESGLQLLIVRSLDLAPGQQAQLLRRLRELRRGTPLRVLLSGTALAARQAGACGLHSSAAALRTFMDRPPTRLWAVSAHSRADLERAQATGADVVLLSPVLPTTKHPADEALGWDGFASLTASTPLPIYAQGGMLPSDIGTARALGAVGVAVDISRL